MSGEAKKLSGTEAKTRRAVISANTERAARKLRSTPAVKRSQANIDRVARRLNVASCVVGSVMKIVYNGVPGPRLVVESPDGSRHSFVAPDGAVDLWLPQVGSWSYAWEGSQEVSSISVVADRSSSSAAPALPATVAVGDLGPMKMVDRPKR